MTLMATQSISRLAPAKVNLSLSVLGIRPDGFHDIESWIAPIDWCDRITVTPGNGPSLTVDGDADGIPVDDTNLAMRAAEALAHSVDRANDVAIRLEKSIPPGAGLGGGSSDAATVLLTLNTLWNLNLSTETLVPIAAEIGSDVPFFLEPGSAIIRGRGERIERLDHFRHGWLVLIVPPFGISTESVYRAWSTAGGAEPGMGGAASHREAPWLDPSVDAASLMPPPGAGLGGGSSDAATVLLTLNTLWNLNLSTETLVPIAAEIGSDVPFFLEPGSAIIRGRGERIERLDHFRHGWLVLIVPPFGISTESVYRAWSTAGGAEPGMGGAASHREAPWLDPSVDAASLMPRVFNDLEPAAFGVEPRLATLHAVLDGLEGCLVRMTGSGSALFTLLDDESDADAWRRAARGLVQPDVMIHGVRLR